MKTKLIFICFFIIGLSLSGFSQLKVNSSGKVGIGLVAPDATYNLSLTSAVFKAGGTYPDLIVGPNPLGNQTRAIYPSVNNNGSLGWSTRKFFSVYATTFYGTLDASSSDKRLKENFRTIDKPLDIILQMSGKKYDFIDQETNSFKSDMEKKRDLRINRNRLGFFAQDLEKILPEAVFYFENEDHYYLDYNAIIPVLVEAMKEQQAQIEELKSELASCCQGNLKSGLINGSDDINLNGNPAKLYQNNPNPFSNQTNSTLLN